MAQHSKTWFSCAGKARNSQELQGEDRKSRPVEAKFGGCDMDGLGWAVFSKKCEVKNMKIQISKEFSYRISEEGKYELNFGEFDRLLRYIFQTNDLMNKTGFKIEIHHSWDSADNIRVNYFDTVEIK